MIDSQLEIEAGAVMSAGMQLRALRHSKSMDVAVLAGILKVPPQRIRDLEADRFDQLPDLSFVRALATSICRVLKVDAAPVLAALPKGNVQVALEELQAVAEQRAALRDTGSASRSDRTRRGLLWLAAVVLILAGALWAWGRGSLPELPGASGMSAGPAPAPSASTEAPPASSSAPMAPSTTASEVSATGGSTAMPAPLTPTSPDGQAGIPAASASASAAPLAQPASPAADGRAQVTLSASEPSWVEVRSSPSTVVFAGTLSAGQSMTLSVVEPASLVVGNVRATRLSWRGQEVDLMPFARDNVARLTWPQQP